MTILPGFELESTEGIHVLCIYSSDTAVDQLQRFLGEFVVRDTEPSSSQCGEDFVSILGKVRTQGGITIAAHSTGDKGLFKGAARTSPSQGVAFGGSPSCADSRADQRTPPRITADRPEIRIQTTSAAILWLS